ncbi:MAG: ATP-binding cassette domain-containing protein, partial [Anaerolineae bacterium]
GLSLATLLGAFVTAQRALTVRALVRLIPRAFGSLALVGAVALSYIPSVGDQVAAVREAQAVRGHRVTGPRSWAALALPMLVGALERSAQLAESMASRGLVIADETPIAGRVAFAAGLAVLLLGWLGAATGTMGAAPAAALAVGGVALSGGALLWLGRRAPYTDFRPQPTCPRDAAIAAVAWLPLLVTLVDDGAAAALAYSPMPELALPPLDPWLVLGVAGLAAPVLAVAGLATPALLTPRLRTRGAGAPAGRGEAAVDASIAARAVDASIAPSAADTTIATEAAAGVATPPLRQRAGSRTPEQPADVFFIGYGVRYPGASSPALNDIDLRLPAGGLTVVAGPSGSGKSTLLRSINGLVPHFTGGQTWGAVTVGGTRARHCGAGGAAADVGFVPGDPESSFVMDTVADEVAFALEHQAISRDEMRDRVSAALRRVGLAGLEDRPLRRLSGGERQRVAVAAALALEPRVLLLDEPTSQLDDECASDVLAAVADVSARGDVTVVLVEHRLDRVLPYASQLVYLPGNGGRPLAGAPADVLRAVDVPSAPLATPVEPGATLLALRDITFRYGDSAVLTDASMAVRAGEVVALTGRSGSGKSTVLRLAVGLLRPDTGEVTIAGRSIAGRDTAEICRAAGYLPQDPSALLFAESVRDELRVTLANHGLPSNETDEGALLVALGIEHLAKRYPRELSTGQRQRAALASVTVTDPPLLLLDEPTRGMDDAAIADLATLLHERAAAGRGVLVATHDRRLIRAAHRRLRLERGRIEPAQLRW